MFTDKPVSQFLDELASSAPVPGGGSGAALAGALGAGLLSMVGNLTIGKKKYAAVEAEVKDLLSRTEALRQELLQLLEADTQVYSRVMAAYKLPKETEAEKGARQSAIQQALIAAAEVPLRITEKCATLMDLSLPLAEKGNVGAISDVGVGILLAEAGLHSAILNVEINLASIEDRAFVSQTRARLGQLMAGKKDLRDRVLSIVREKIGG